MPDATNLAPWHSELARQILQAAPIRLLIQRAPNAMMLADLWKLVSIELYHGRLEPDNATLRRWKEAVGTRTIELMRENPAQAPFVYSTMFTFFDGTARDALHVEFLAIVKDVPPNPSST